MCTNANSKPATFNVEFSTIENTVKGQIEMIQAFGGTPEAIYMEKGLYDQLVDKVLEANLLTKEDVILKRYLGLPINRMDDVRNMNHHQYFKGWAIPIQVTVVADSYPLPAEKQAKADWNKSGRTIGDLPGKVKFEAMKEVESQPEYLRSTRENRGSEFDILKVRLDRAFDFSETEKGFEYWSGISNGNFEADDLQKIDGAVLTPLQENLSGAKTKKLEASYSDDDIQAFMDDRTLENLPTELMNKALANFDGGYANTACGFDIYDGNAKEVRLNAAFDWNNSNEGEEFWSAVYNGNWSKVLNQA